MVVIGIYEYILLRKKTTKIKKQNVYNWNITIDRDQNCPKKALNLDIKMQYKTLKTSIQEVHILFIPSITEIYKIIILGTHRECHRKYPYWRLPWAPPVWHLQFPVVSIQTDATACAQGQSWRGNVSQVFKVVINQSNVSQVIKV